MVYNHTGEGGAWNGNDPTTYNIFSWRGLDNPTYYELTSDMQYSYDNTGVGGNYNTYNPVAQNLIVDSLAYWRDTMGVDGFRFDLGSVLGNTCTVGCFNFSDSIPTRRSIVSCARAATASGYGRQRHRPLRRALGDRRQWPTSWVVSRRAGRNGTATIATRLRQAQNDLGVGYHHHRSVGDALRRFVRPVRQPQPVELDQFHGRARRLHAQRPV